MIDVQEERESLLTQRESGRRGCMVGLDKSFQHKEENKKKNQQIFEKKKKESDEGKRNFSEEEDKGWELCEQSIVSKTKNLERNCIFDKVRNVGQNVINTKLAIIEKVKDGSMVCKAQLVARGLRRRREKVVNYILTYSAEEYILIHYLIFLIFFSYIYEKEVQEIN